MKYFQVALLCFFCFAKSYGQTVTKSYGRIDVEIIKEKKPKKIYTKVEIKSAFPGGDSSWVNSLEESLDQSIRVDRRVKKGRYVVSVMFIIDKEGSLADIRCENDPGFEMCEEVVKVVARKIKKSPKWLPSSKPVKEYRRSSIIY